MRAKRALLRRKERDAWRGSPGSLASQKRLARDDSAVRGREIPPRVGESTRVRDDAERFEGSGSLGMTKQIPPGSLGSRVGMTSDFPRCLFRLARPTRIPTNRARRS